MTATKNTKPEKGKRSGIASYKVKFKELPMKKLTTLVTNLFSSILFWLIIIVIIYALLTWCDISKYNNPNDEWWPKFHDQASNFLIGFIISCFFYFLVVYLPDRRRRNIIKLNFTKMYENIKRDILHQIIFASQKEGIKNIHADFTTIETLMTIEGFKKVFSGGREANEGWYAFVNSIKTNQSESKKIISNLNFLSNQINFILAHYVILDKQLFSSLKNLELNIFQLNSLDLDCDDIKILSRFLWQMFTGWNFANGYSGYDPIKRIIEEI